MVWHVNEVFELKTVFFINIFHWKGQIGQNISSKIYNFLRQYYSCITFSLSVYFLHDINKMTASIQHIKDHIIQILTIEVLDMT